MRVVLALTAVLALSSCSSASTQACGAAGAASGVSFDTSSWSDAGPLTAHACVGTRCVDRPLGNGQPRLIFVDAPSLSSDAPIAVSLTVQRPDSRAVFKATTTVRPQKFLPNGQGCAPTAWQSRVQPTDHGLALVVK